MMPFDKLKEEMLGTLLRRKGHERAAVQPGQKQCPQCGKVYAPDLPPEQGSPEQREQHMTGICSTVCWNNFLGPEPE